MGLERPQAPHRTTYSRILGETLDVAELEEAVGRFFSARLTEGQLVQVVIDGKTLRSSIPAGDSRGVHLMAAYLPSEGVVLAQVEVDGKENEIKAAPRLLEAIDLRARWSAATPCWPSVNCRRKSWSPGENTSGLSNRTSPNCATTSPPSSKTDRRRGRGRRILLSRHVGQGAWTHPTAGADRQRRLGALSGLARGRQVFRLEPRFEYVKTGRVSWETCYGITSLGPEQATPQGLLEIARTHWNIENGLHYRRDETLREDWCHLRLGHAQRMMAAVNNLVLGLLLRRGVSNVPQQRRRYAARWIEALKLITTI